MNNQVISSVLHWATPMYKNEIYICRILEQQFFFLLFWATTATTFTEWTCIKIPNCWSKTDSSSLLCHFITDFYISFRWSIRAYAFLSLESSKKSERELIIELIWQEVRKTEGSRDLDSTVICNYNKINYRYLLEYAQKNILNIQVHWQDCFLTFFLRIS